MEQERLAREKEENDKAEQAEKLKESFGDASSQWEKDKSEMQNIAGQDKKTDQRGQVSDKPKKEGKSPDKPENNDRRADSKA